jgi:hypothetical protein
MMQQDASAHKSASYPLPPGRSRLAGAAAAGRRGYPARAATNQGGLALRLLSGERLRCLTSY